MSKKRLKTPAKELRKNSTNAESLLWKHLRQKQLHGHKFRRQQPIDDFIVDFVCLERRVVIEVDGGQHAADKEKDTVRDIYLKSNGFRVLRFWNHEVLQNIEGVLEVILTNCKVPPPLSPLPPGEGKS